MGALRVVVAGWVLSLALIMSGCSGREDAVPDPPEGTPEPAAEPEPVVAEAAAAEPVAVIADLHVDTITAMMTGNVPWTDESLEAPLPALREAGVNVVVQAAWIPRGDPDPRGTALGKLRRIRSMVQASGGAAAIVTGPGQLERVVAEGRIAVILSLEGGTALTDGEATLRELREIGLSMVGLTWSESSQYADSSATPRRGAAGGLTDAGRELVVTCNSMGLILDVSHMSDRATAETVALSTAPVVASHSNVRALCDVPRNLNDELLTTISERGGLVGAMFHGPYVVPGRRATRADVVAQILGLVDRIGADHVALGSDWDGIIKAPEGLAGPRDLGALRTDLQAAGLSQEQVDDVFGRSFVRLWKDVARATD